MNGKVLKLLKTTTLQNGITFNVGQEIEIVQDVVYVGGYPLPPNVQATVLNWIKSNPSLFKDDTRNWK